jgi:putative ABC transport system substrate-binding protein
MIRRRDCITLFCGAVAAWPVRTWAQQSQRVRRIGVLMAMAPGDVEAVARVKAFEAAWPQLGWTKGRTVEVDYRWADGDLSNLQKRAAEVVAAAPEVILAISTPVLAAMRGATRSIPIVFVGVSDPDGTGVVASIARPGGNITGFANFEPTIGGKWLQVLKEMQPDIVKVCVLRNPAGVNFFRSIRDIAPSVGMEQIDCSARTLGEIEQSLGPFAGQNVGLIVMPDPIFTAQRQWMSELAARYRMPALYPFRSFVRDGGLIAYSVDPIDQVRRAPFYIDRILKGEKPGDLPVQAPTKYELVINLKTARALGITVPPTLLARADEVIE